MEKKIAVVIILLIMIRFNLDQPSVSQPFVCKAYVAHALVLAMCYNFILLKL